jgi:PD-(D/E)XK endonuclease
MRTSVRIMSETTWKGAIAEAAITAVAVELGFVVLRPLVEGRRYDLVIDTGPRLLRVQCKWAPRKGDVIVVHTSTRRLTPHGYVVTTYAADEIEGIGAYCHELKRCFLSADRRGGSAPSLPSAPRARGKQPETRDKLGRRLRIWGYSSVGRALDWQSRGRGFESP